MPAKKYKLNSGFNADLLDAKCSETFVLNAP
jgi:hypothetical protein